MSNTLVYSFLLWTFFSFQHSFLARPYFKLIIEKLFGNIFIQHFYPIIYFISQCIIFLLIYDLIRNLGPNVLFFTIAEYLEIFIYIFNKIAHIFLILTIFHFDIAKFTGFTQFLAFFFKKKENNILVDTLNKFYLYKYIRHPMYLGIILVYISSTTIYTDIFFVNVFCILAYIEIGSYFEEKTLLKKFGREYEQYQTLTKKYIPFIK